MALILSRRSDESILIGDQIFVKVVGVSGNRVRLAITAPENVRILRTEIEDGFAVSSIDEEPTVAIPVSA